jgi:hypothetical protein
VLCLGDLTALGFQRADPFFTFDEFERTVTDFARCLKPGGLLLLHATNFRFGDTRVAAGFDVALEASAAQREPVALFDRENRLLPGEVYAAVGFRKRSGERDVVVHQPHDH